MPTVRASVLVHDQEHPRAGQAGVVLSIFEGDGSALVRFDLEDQETGQRDEALAADQLTLLGVN
jgi:hypothetical protein